MIYHTTYVSWEEKIRFGLFMFIMILKRRSRATMFSTQFMEKWRHSKYTLNKSKRSSNSKIIFLFLHILLNMTYHMLFRCAHQK